MPAAKGKSTAATEIPDELQYEIKKRAKAEGRSRSAIIARSIMFYLKYAPVTKRSLMEGIIIPEPNREQK